MINDITIKNEASYNAAGQPINNLKKINFFYGSNGSGKTTISRVIDEQDKYPDCKVVWKAGNKLKTFVYNRDFVERNFHPDKGLKGIFTLGEHEGNVLNDIESAKVERDDISKKLNGKKNTLEGADGDAGKRAELDALESEFMEQCWTYKKKYNDDFNKAFKGCGKRESFKERLLNEKKSNKSTLLSIEELQEKAKTVFADDLTKEIPIPPILYFDLIDLEETAILSKKIIGKDDVDIAAMIEALGNSDWVKEGKNYFEKNDGHCPFCQQKTKEAFEKDLGEYFNDTYSNDVDAIDALITDYERLSKEVLRRFEAIEIESPIYLDCKKFKAQKDIIEAKIALNKQRISSKKKEPSSVIVLESLKNILDEVSTEVTAANDKVKSHNDTKENLTTAKRDLTNQIWCFIIEEIKPTYDIYSTKKNGFDTAISTLEEAITKLAKEKVEKKDAILELEGKITSIQPTIDEINSLLKEFGFIGFSFAESEEKGQYKIVRSGGEDAQETLSEGEKTFVTFLYFYHLLKGSYTESGITEDRVVVFDDPVSSLDGDILFIVGALIKRIFEDVRSNEGNIRQVFILTHNIYFHKEISFKAPQNETFWIIKKDDGCSVVKFHETNPIRNSYELLWSDVRDPNRSNATIRNTLRRILEHYFKILGNINLDDIASKFDGKDKFICRVLLSWVHDGSHCSDDDLYVACDDQTVVRFLEIFHEIFKKSENSGHYNMMMGISEGSNQPSKSTNIQAVGT